MSKNAGTSSDTIEITLHEAKLLIKIFQIYEKIRQLWIFYPIKELQDSDI